MSDVFGPSRLCSRAATSRWRWCHRIRHAVAAVGYAAAYGYYAQVSDIVDETSWIRATYLRPSLAARPGSLQCACVVDGNIRRQHPRGILAAYHRAKWSSSRLAYCSVAWARKIPAYRLILTTSALRLASAAPRRIPPPEMK
jgi:hypothetical protein